MPCWEESDWKYCRVTWAANSRCSDEANLCLMGVKEHILQLVSFYGRQSVLLVYFEGEISVTACVMSSTMRLWIARCSQTCKVNSAHKLNKGFVATNELQKWWLLYRLWYANISKLELSWKPSILRRVVTGDFFSAVTRLCKSWLLVGACFFRSPKKLNIDVNNMLHRGACAAEAVILKSTL